MSKAAIPTHAALAAAIFACSTLVVPALAAPVSFDVPLSGSAEVPAVQTQGKGTAHITWDASTRTVTWQITDTGLSGPVTMAHFHSGPPGKNGVVVIWLTKKGSNPNGVIKGEQKLTADQAAQFEAGDWYINVHTKAHPAGEVRGQAKPPKS
jgi:CHRD domain